MEVEAIAARVPGPRLGAGMPAGGQNGGRRDCGEGPGAKQTKQHGPSRQSVGFEA